VVKTSVAEQAQTIAELRQQLAESLLREKAKDKKLQERDRQLARGLMDHRLNVDRTPDRIEEFVLRPGEALVIPAFAFHAVEGDGDVSIALTYMVATADTERRRSQYQVIARTA